MALIHAPRPTSRHCALTGSCPNTSDGSSSVSGNSYLEKMSMSFHFDASFSKRLTGTSTVLKVIRQLMCRLIQLNIICPGHDHHDNSTVHVFLDLSPKLRAFCPQLLHRRLDVIAHKRDRVVPRVIISFAFPHA